MREFLVVVPSGREVIVEADFLQRVCGDGSIALMKEGYLDEPQKAAAVFKEWSYIVEITEEDLP